MSADTTPISPSRFAAALKDLSLPMLHLKTLEIRNSIAHLQYSNDQLKPFAEGAQSCTPPRPSDPPAPDPTAPDQDCIDAIRENELVIDRMAERIVLIRAEVEVRGFSWREFQSADEAAARAIPVPVEQTEAAPQPGSQAQPHSRQAQTDTETDSQTQRQTQTQTGSAVEGQGQDAHNPWTDGTFTTGTIRNGQIHMDPVPQGAHAPANTNGRAGLTDEQLRAALEERMREPGGPDEDDEGGLHL